VEKVSVAVCMHAKKARFDVQMNGMTDHSMAVDAYYAANTCFNTTSKEHTVSVYVSLLHHLLQCCMASISAIS
jgi:hypothetical protein